MGLGREDPYVRNRLALKLELMLGDLSVEEAPAEEDLARFLEQHTERFAEPARVSFRQVYLDSNRHPDPVAEAERLLTLLRNGTDPAELGDATLLASRVEAATLSEVARQFGSDFAATLEGLGAGVWSHPVRSPLGLHLILLSERQPARRPALAEIRDEVMNEWRDQRRREAREQAYLRLRERYEIVVETVESAYPREGAVAAPLPKASEVRP